MIVEIPNTPELIEISSDKEPDDQLNGEPEEKLEEEPEDGL